MTNAEIIHAHRQINPADNLNRIDAARFILSTTGQHIPVETEQTAVLVLTGTFTLT